MSECWEERPRGREPSKHLWEEESTTARGLAKGRTKRFVSPLHGRALRMCVFMRLSGCVAIISYCVHEEMYTICHPLEDFVNYKGPILERLTICLGLPNWNVASLGLKLRYIPSLKPSSSPHCLPPGRLILRMPLHFKTKPRGTSLGMEIPQAWGMSREWIVFRTPPEMLRIRFKVGVWSDPTLLLMTEGTASE